MKVIIGPYINYFGPFQLAEKLLFWKDKNKINEVDPLDVHKDYDDIYNLGLFLEKAPGLSRFCSWVYDKRQRKVRVQVHGYDIWSADHTLALVIVPILKQLRENKNSSGGVDDEDVPDELKSTSATPLTEEEKNVGEIDDNYVKRWEWILDEMIWAFEQSTIDWEEQYYSGNSDFSFVKMENGLSEMVNGPNHTFQVDRDGIKNHRKRMERGRMLFAKYYESLWS